MKKLIGIIGLGVFAAMAVKFGGMVYCLIQLDKDEVINDIELTDYWNTQYYKFSDVLFTVDNGMED